tara:strand:- start:273 stop:527 length:255 start_codon:yes stop_codon:yes gene_type:complete
MFELLLRFGRETSESSFLETVGDGQAKVLCASPGGGFSKSGLPFIKEFGSVKCLQVVETSVKVFVHPYALLSRHMDASFAGRVK